MTRSLAEVTDYDTLLRALRARRDELGISVEVLDKILGLGPRYSEKLLSLKRTRQFCTPTMLGLLLGGLGVKLLLVENDEAKRRLEPYVGSRCEFQVRHRAEVVTCA
jgi:hypothetical protein